jgi:heat shock protein HspQ
MYEKTLDKGLAVNNVAKALAYFVFRKIIEDVHAEYNITQEEMMAMNKRAVNRAAAFLECIGDDEKMAAVVSLYSFQTTGWDNPKKTADIRKFHELADEFTEALRSTKGKTNRELFGGKNP